MNWLGLDHIQLAIPVGAEDLCRAFYGTILGWKEVSKPESLTGRGGVWFSTDSFQVHFGVEKDFQPAKKAHPAFLLKDLDHLAKELANHDIAVQWDDKLEGYNRFFAHDCFGNRLEFMQKTGT
ncbi:glyoxalase [Kiloniella litopenaei]|uniref:Glyoxalase n=1 Tax=Kiloniella litopenaei TaxID=1549748 RepID=A0A0M2R367_9PROT|nr:glyoxalase [Kiloniella litopenaei]KKJ76106.1 glyoxalase [Kiloniella litopenaei]